MMWYITKIAIASKNGSKWKTHHELHRAFVSLQMYQYKLCNKVYESMRSVDSECFVGVT